MSGLNSLVEAVQQEMCDNFCKYPEMQPPEGKDENWLVEDGSPCEKCPLNNLI